MLGEKKLNHFKSQFIQIDVCKVDTINIDRQLSVVFGHTKYHKKGSRNICIFFYLRKFRDFEVNFLVLRQYYSNRHFLCQTLLCINTVLENLPQNCHILCNFVRPKTFYKNFLNNSKFRPCLKQRVYFRTLNADLGFI